MSLVLCTMALFSVNGKDVTSENSQLTGNLTSYTNVQAAQSTSTVPKMKVIITGTGGTVTKNYYIKKNIPNTQLTKQVVALAKKGTPMVVFGNGSGPKVLIVAGVHGNELPAQIASVKLINYLKGKKIKGTVYIVPFVIPSSTAKNARFWKGKNLNRVANAAGTPTNKILKLAKQLKVSALADFHSTRPGGVPGKNSVLCTKFPTYGSYKIAKYISKKTGFALIADYKAGAAYPGALEDVTNLAGIPAVTCEVRSSHGYVASGSVNKSYNEMLAFLKYKKII